MRFWNLFLFFVAVTIATILPQAGSAQGRLFDKVVVDLPNDTHVNTQVIPAGHYEFRQMRDDAGASHVMLVTDDGAKHFDAAAITIPAVNNNTPDATRVIVKRIGPAFYLDKIWVAGKDYGYQFTVPKEAEAQVTTVQPITISATYQPEQPAQVAEAAPPPPPPAPVAQTPAPAPPPPAREEPPVIAQATPPPPPPAVEPAPAPAAPAQPAQLPQTASGWASYLMLGVLCTGLAMFLRLRRVA